MAAYDAGVLREEGVSKAHSADAVVFPTIPFNERNTGAADALHAELERLENTAPGDASFSRDMARFEQLFRRYCDARSAPSFAADWASLRVPGPETIVPWAALPACDAPRPEDLARLAVLKLNGGLGTTMGCVGPKSAIEVRAGQSFLDMAVRHVESLGGGVPLVLMNSFNTDAETRRALRKYGGVPIVAFCQSRYPRISRDTLLPVASCASVSADREAWYPPGHGDVFAALADSGVLDALLDAGRDVVFVSNIDNLGASVDGRVLRHVCATAAPLVMEVTARTRADVKGGTLVAHGGRVRLLEAAQVPPAHMRDFASLRRFRIFNTNNLWLNLRAVRAVLGAHPGGLPLEVIANPKTHRGTGEAVLQLETAAGAAIGLFPGAHAIEVPRARFLPVKSCSDLFLARSDLYDDGGSGVLVPRSGAGAVAPTVKLGEAFRRVPDFLARFDGPPNVAELEHLTVSGDVHFGAGVTLKGTVIIVAHAGARIDVPAGAVLEDKVVTGNLRILDH